MSLDLEHIWNQVVGKLGDLISQDDLITLRACFLDEENGKYIIQAPNIFAVQHIEKKLLNVLELALSKHGISSFSIQMHTPTLYANPSKKEKKSQSIIGQELIKEYQFSNFVEGGSNNNAYAAARRVSEGLFSEEFNPLLIYGGTGLGKSHLMHAAGNALKERGKSNILYLTAETFTNEFIKALREKSMQHFVDTLRNADALLIDDVQFLAGKNSSQTEFFHTFNSLFDKKRPIILTCDRYPKEIEGLEDRLKSRFGAGLTVSIAPPDYETRMAILQNKASYLNFDLAPEVAQFIAHNVASNVRDLEGALRKVYALCQFQNQPASMAIAQEALKDLISATSKQISLENIRNVVANYYKISIADMDSPRRKASITLPRQVAMHLARALTRHSTTEIGEVFGKRDHTTVLNACRKVDKLLQDDANFSEEYKGLTMMITG